MSHEVCEPVILATDLDGTFAHGTAADRDRLVSLLEAQGAATLIYVTGRTPDAARELAARTPLPDPDLLIADVGTSVLRRLGPGRLADVEAELGQGWPGAAEIRRRLEPLAPDLVPQDIEAPRRSSWWIEAVREHAGAAADPFAARGPGDPSLTDAAAATAEAVAVRARHRLQELDVDVVVSANVFLDVLPRGVNKGSTLRRVLTWLGADATRCMVAGDSLNDLALFETGMAGVVVGNCEPALRRRVAALPHVYRARAEGVAGVLEGLRHHGFIHDGNTGGHNAE